MHYKIFTKFGYSFLVIQIMFKNILSKFYYKFQNICIEQSIFFSFHFLLSHLMCLISFFFQLLYLNVISKIDFSKFKFKLDNVLYDLWNEEELAR